MCRDCEHWRRAEARDDHGIRVAPCALKPTRTFRDSRVDGGYERVTYVTTEDYECGNYRERV